MRVTLQYKHAGFSGLAGVARSDITPPPGIYARNWGAADHDTAEGIHRPLSVTAMAISDGPGDKNPLVFVDADLGWWRSLPLANDFRRRLLDRLGLEEARFVLALTHTHSAPPLTEQIEPDWEGGKLLPPYLDRVFEATADAVTRAREALRPAFLEWRTGRCALATTRDLRDPEDPSRIVCGFDPEAPADDTLLVGRVCESESRSPIAVLVNYACHPTTLAWDNRLISPDYLGAMRETIERNWVGCLTLFAQGASGDLSPRFQYTHDPDVADAHGRELGHAVLATLAGMEPPGTHLAYDGVRESGAPLATWRREPYTPSRKLEAVRIDVNLPLKPWPTSTELERELHAATDRVTRERLRRKLAIRRGLGDGDTFAFPTWIWKIGDAVLVANMAESYSVMQRNLRAAFPDRPIIYLNLANGSIGYLPPVALYDENVYQVWQTPFDQGSLERLETAIADNLRASA